MVCPQPQVLTITTYPFQTGAGSKPYSLEAGQAGAWSFDSKPTSPHILPRGAEGSPFPSHFPFSEKPDRPQPAPLRGAAAVTSPSLPIPPPAQDKSPGLFAPPRLCSALGTWPNSRMRAGVSRQALFPKPAGCTSDWFKPLPSPDTSSMGLWPLQPTGCYGALTCAPHLPSTKKSPLKAGLWSCPKSQGCQGEGRDRCDCVFHRGSSHSRSHGSQHQVHGPVLAIPSLPGGGLLCIQYGVS